MNRSIQFAIAALLATVAAQQTAAQTRPPAAIQTARASLRELSPSISATGQVQSRSGADMAAGVGGPLDFVAEPGTRVVKDQVIARIDTGEIRLQRAEQAARVTRGELALKQAERELERLRASGNPIGWFLGQVWDRFRDRPLWSSQQAVRNARDEADVILYLVNASEDPAGAGYVALEMEILGWIGKPVVLLLNPITPHTSHALGPSAASDTVMCSSGQYHAGMRWPHHS